MPKFQIKMVTHQGIFFDEEINSFSFNSSQGRYTILPNHAKMLCNIENGVATITTLNNTKRNLVTGNGYIKVENNIVNVVSDMIYFEEDFEEVQILKELENLKIKQSQKLSKNEENLTKIIFDRTKAKLLLKNRMK